MKLRRALLSFALPLLVAAAGCGGQSTPGGDPPAGPSANWSWIDVDGAFCGDGSPTGIAVYPGSSDLLVFLDGGGACWTWDTCFGNIRSIITAGPFGAAQLPLRMAVGADSVLDAGAASDPFAGWTKVFVPYCTGDVHSGDTVTTYTGPQGQTAAFHHVGHANVLAALGRIVAEVPAPSRVVVSGSSAGGFGSFINYPTLRASWPDAPGYLVDDSGPAVAGLSPDLTGGWTGSWDLTGATDAWCPDCSSDLSAVYGVLSARYSDDRMALLSYLQDGTISMFFGLAPADLATKLGDVATKLGALPGWRWFYQSGVAHTMLGNPAAHVQGDVTLTSFLEKMIGGDPTWSSVSP